MSNNKGMNNTQKLVIAFAAFAVILGALQGLQHGLAQVDFSTLPPPFSDILGYVADFFESSTLLMIIAYFRNLLGYGYNWLAQYGKGTEVPFDFQRYQKTIMYYIGVINVFAAPLPEPFNFVVITLGVFVDILTSEWKKLQQALGQ